jgi:DNA-binding transcriptional LysR family regulator
MSLLSRETEYFLEICKTANVARAAEALGLSQPAVTRSLQRLEQQVGATLFVRAPRGVELTAIGAAFRRRLEQAQLTLDDAEKEIAQLAAGKVGRVRIGVGHVVARPMSAVLFPRLIVERPAAQIDLHVAFDAELFALVGQGRLDLAVCGLLDEPPPDLEFRRLSVTDLLVVVRQGHPLTRKSNPTIRDLKAFRRAVPIAGARTRQVAEKRMLDAGLGGTPPALESNSWEALLEAVATTDLFSMAPVYLANVRHWADRLAIVDVAGLRIALTTGVVLRAGAYLSPIATRALELIEMQIATTGREGKSSPKGGALRRAKRRGPARRLG